MIMRSRSLSALALMSCLAFGASACSDDTDTSLPSNLQASYGTDAASPTPTPAETETTDTNSTAGTEMLVVHFEYPTLTVKPGATIIGKDGDQADHTITSKQAGLFDVTVTKGESSTFKAPTAEGTYDLICRFHSSMSGKLIVKA